MLPSIYMYMRALLKIFHHIMHTVPSSAYGAICISKYIEG